MKDKKKTNGIENTIGDRENFTGELTEINDRGKSLLGVEENLATENYIDDLVKAASVDTDEDSEDKDDDVDFAADVTNIFSKAADIGVDDNVLNPLLKKLLDENATVAEIEVKVDALIKEKIAADNAQKDFEERTATPSPSPSTPTYTPVKNTPAQIIDEVGNGSEKYISTGTGEVNQFSAADTTKQSVFAVENQSVVAIDSVASQMAAQKNSAVATVGNGSDTNTGEVGEDSATKSLILATDKVADFKADTGVETLCFETIIDDKGNEIEVPDIPFEMPNGFKYDENGIYYNMPVKKTKREIDIEKRNNGGELPEDFCEFKFVLTLIMSAVILPSKFFPAGIDADIGYEMKFYNIEKRKLYTLPRHLTSVDLTTASKITAAINSQKVAVSDKFKTQCADFYFKFLTINDGRIKTVNRYSQIGWREIQNVDGTITKKFIMPIPNKDAGYIVNRGNIDYASVFASRGSRQIWFDMFRKIVDGAYRQINLFIIGSALTAPLLESLFIPNMVVNVNGVSSSGKSAITKFAVSIFGKPTADGYGMTWAGTKKDRNARAAAYSCCPLLVDELNTMDPNERKTCTNFVFNFASGIINQALKSDGSHRKKESFKSVLLSSGEYEYLPTSANQGAFKRLIDIHLDKPLFDINFAQEIHICCERNHGLFWRDWINYIIANEGKIFADFKKVQADTAAILAKKENDQARFIVAAVVAYYHFICCITESKDFDFASAVDSVKAISTKLTDLALMSDSARHLGLLADWILRFKDRFTFVGIRSDDDIFNLDGIGEDDGYDKKDNKPLRRFVPAKESVGVITSNLICFYKGAIEQIARRAETDNGLGLASANKVIDDAKRAGLLVADPDRNTYRLRVGRINSEKKRITVVAFSRNLLTYVADTAAAADEEKNNARADVEKNDTPCSKKVSANLKDIHDTDTDCPF